MWVNNPLNSRLASYKVWQLLVALKVGLKIPDTLITNNVRAFKPFDKTHPSLVGKVVNATPTTSPKRLVPTRLVDSVLRSNLNALRLAPVQFQERIMKDSDVRVNVVGEKVFATSILSKHVDMRLDLEKSEHQPHELPEKVRLACLELCENLGLRFGAIDLLAAKGEYYFLEVNPNGKWGWIEEATRQPIAEAFATLLTSPSS